MKVQVGTAKKVVDFFVFMYVIIDIFTKNK